MTLCVKIGMDCLHCLRRDGVRRPRGLCWRCNDDPVIRARYPVLPRARDMYRPRCRHCGKGIATARRGLCNICEHTPAIRDQYPIRAKRGHGPSNGNATPPVPPEPTHYAPGTLRKMVVMRKRARLGFQVFHPLDAIEHGGESKSRDQETGGRGQESGGNYWLPPDSCLLPPDDELDPNLPIFGDDRCPLPTR